MKSVNAYIVLPCYNEEEVLPETLKRMLELFGKMREENLISTSSRIVFVDDGSKDRTWEIIEKLHEEDPIYQGVKLSRNKGHQNALLAGLMTVKDKCDMTISLDADLQDDIEVFDEMVEKFSEGCDIVYGIRNDRSSDSFMKRFTAEGYYRLMEFFGTHIIFNHADYRLMSRRALEALSEYSEINLFLRGIVPTIGVKSSTVGCKMGV